MQSATVATEEQVSYQSVDVTTLLKPGVKKMTPDTIEERQKFLQGHGGRCRDGHKPVPPGY